MGSDVRILVVTTDPSFAIGAARMHADAKVLVASPNQLPSRSVEAFDAAVIDAGDRNGEVVGQLRHDLTADRLVVIGDGPGPDGTDATLARPFTLEELAAVLGLDALPLTRDEDGRDGFLGRLMRRFHLAGEGPDGETAPPRDVPRVRAWPRMDVDHDPVSAAGYDEAIVAGDRLRELLDGLPPVASVAEEAVAVVVAVRERLEGQLTVAWLESDGSFHPHHTEDRNLAPLDADHPVLSALAEDVSAVVLEPAGPAVDLVGGDVPGVAVAGIRYAGRLLGAVAVGRRALSVADRDTLLAIAREHAPRLALARTMERLRG